MLCSISLLPCFCLFGLNACWTRVKCRRNGCESGCTICCFRRVAQVFIAWMSQSLVPWQLFCSFLCMHGIDWNGVLVKDGLDWASKDLWHSAALSIEIFGRCANTVIRHFLCLSLNVNCQHCRFLPCCFHRVICVCTWVLFIQIHDDKWMCEAFVVNKHTVNLHVFALLQFVMAFNAEG